MNILLVATESIPYSKTGGLADVVHGLARELCGQGHDARIVVPCYRGLLGRVQMEKIVSELKVPLGTYVREAAVWKSHRELTTYLIQHDFFFGRDDLYGYLDDYERFIFFTRATLEMLSSADFQELESGWFPQIIQGYDWPTGLIPGWLPYYEEKDPRFVQTRFVLSVYNLGRLGIFGIRALRVAEQERTGILDPVKKGPERVHFLSRGILSADKIVTSYPYHSQEASLPESAQSLRAILNSRLEQGDLVAIQNAIDYQEYNPSADTYILNCFSEWSMRDRIQNKLALQEELELDKSERTPMIGMVSRLNSEKGFDLFPALRDDILDSGSAQFVALFDPDDPYYMKTFDQWEQDWVKIRFGFEEQLARRIYAGCDIFLMPSKEEAAGIQQFIVTHYGAVPVVHQTGVLRDLVRQYQPEMKLEDPDGRRVCVGFTFTDFTPESFCGAVQAAIDLYRKDQQTWLEIQRHNIRQDFSWYWPAKHYLEVYEEAQQSDRAEIVKGSLLTLDRNEQLLQAILEIDSLPGLARRDSHEMLQQAARLVRDTVQCDAVYVWTLREGRQLISQALTTRQMQLVSESLDRSENPERPRLYRSLDGVWKPPERLAAVEDFVNQGASNIWRRSADLDLSRICRPILSLFDSSLAQEEHWVDGRSVSTTAHSRVLGRIDVLFREKIPPEADEWLTYALTTLANSFGFRLESIRLKRETDQILDTDKKLLQARSFTEVAHALIELARSLAHADAVSLYLFENGELTLIEPSDIIETDPQLARSAAETGAVVYVADSSAGSNDYERTCSFCSIMAIPLSYGLESEIAGVLEVAREPPVAFSRDDERVLQKHLAPQAAVAMQTARWHTQRDQSRVEQLRTLAVSLVGGGDFDQLLERVVTTTAQVLEARAASLYLINKDTGRLEIRAAAGYHEPLMAHGASYDLGEGTTGWIAQTRKTFKADSLDELHNKTPWKGKHKRFQGNQEPEAFLGVPLKIVDRACGEEQITGVLKLEDRIEQPPHPRAIFSDEDARLGEMMANVIATVVYNAQLSEQSLRELSTNLGRLSSALAGSQDMQTLMGNVVNTIAEVLQVDAATLYLADDKSQRLVVQAAYGYQKPLVAAKAFYEWGEGVTGRIAQTNRPFQANILEVLRKEGGSEKGKYDDLQGGKRPTSFYGLPLNVEGRDKPIGVLKVESLVKRPFTSEDVLLIEMMANVIATVVYNAQLDQARLGRIIKSLGSMVEPRQEAARELLSEFAGSPDLGTIKLLAAALVSAIGSDGERTCEEAIALWKVGAIPEIFTHIADAAHTKGIQRRFQLFYEAARAKGIESTRLGDVYKVSHLWTNLEEASESAEGFESAVEALVQVLGKACEAEVVQRITFGDWRSLLLDTRRTFENTYLPDKLCFAFHRRGYPQDEDLEDLRHILAEHLEDQKRVVLPLWSAEGIIERTREMLRNELQLPFAIDTVVLDVGQIQRIVGAPRPDIELQRAVLSQISLLNISPYKTVGPTDERIFFGREKELGQISDGVRRTSFAVIGGRRIGKTSILFQLHRVRLPAAGFRTIYQDCSVTPTCEAFLAAIANDWRPEPPSDLPATFGDLLQSPPLDKPLVLLLDEADKLVLPDCANNWPLFNALRALANSGRAQVVLSGERTLRGTLRDSTSPLFNFANEMLLGPLDFRAVEKLITRPMKQLEIGLADEEEVVRRIYDFTSGHPSVVQRLCSRLIERLNEQGSRRITLDDADAVINDPGFQEEDFLNTYWERATPLEKIISLLMAQEARIYRLKEVRQLLSAQTSRQPSATETKEALDRLVNLRSILKRSQKGYAFAVEAFPQVLASTTTFEDQLQVLIEQYEQTEGQV
jgi:starch synthase